jgi:phosphoribosylglycinamide formyltransferase 1
VRVGVLASGTGTILEALLEAGVPAAVVIADRPCRALDVGGDAGVPSVLVDRADDGGFGPAFDRARYTERVVSVLHEHGVDLVVMAGFGTVLAQPVHDAYPHRIMNTHPALLPAFPGWHAVRAALDAGVAETGCTVHLAGLAVDSGPILARRAVPVLPDDDEADLHERIKAVERTLYPATVHAVLTAMEQGDDPASLELAPGEMSPAAGEADRGAIEAEQCVGRIAEEAAQR